jgi:hypothetical protein
MAAQRSHPTVTTVDEVEMDNVIDEDGVVDVTDPSQIVTALDGGVDMGPRGANQEQGEDGGRWEDQRSPHEPRPDATVANTQNFNGDNRSLAEWQSMGDEVDVETIIVRDVEPDQQYVNLRVIEDIGPVFYGTHEYELKKGVLYKVPKYLADFLYERGKVWSFA